MNGSFALGLLSVLGCVSLAEAQVSRYSLNKVSFHTQSSDDGASAAERWLFSAELITREIPDANSCVLTFGGTRSPFTLAKIPGFAIFRSSGGYFTTQSAFDAAFPSAAYTFTISGGTLGTQAGGHSISNSMYPPSAPYLSDGTFSSLPAMDPTQPFAGRVPGFVPPPGADFARTSISVYRQITNPPVFSVVQDASTTTFSIPGGTLRYGRKYVCSLTYSVTTDQPGVFTGGTNRAFTNNNRATQFAFVVGCIADFNGDQQVDFFDYLDFVAALDLESPEADVDGDGQVDFFDYLDFVRALDVGC